MKQQQFDALAELMKLRKEETRETLRLVLCEGLTHEAAALQAGILRPHLTRAVSTARKVLQLAKAAANGVEEIPARMK